MINPKVQVLSDTSACIAYIELRQVIK